jgi:hypothetical protein
MADLAASSIGEVDKGKGAWGGDACQLMLDTNLNQWTYFTLKAGVEGPLIDSYSVTPGLEDSGKFQAVGCKIARSVEQGIIEMAIPLRAFNHAGRVDPPLTIPIPEGSVWGANIVRDGHGGLGHATWARTTNRWDDRPWEFNAITFAGRRPQNR